MFMLVGLMGVFIAGAAVVAAFSLLLLVLRFALKLILIPLLAIVLLIKMVALLVVGFVIGAIMLPFVAIALTLAGLLALPFFLVSQSRSAAVALNP